MHLITPLTHVRPMSVPSACTAATLVVKYCREKGAKIEGKFCLLSGSCRCISFTLRLYDASDAVWHGSVFYCFIADVSVFQVNMVTLCTY